VDMDIRAVVRMYVVVISRAHIVRLVAGGNHTLTRKCARTHMCRDVMKGYSNHNYFSLGLLLSLFCACFYREFSFCLPSCASPIQRMLRLCFFRSGGNRAGTSCESSAFPLFAISV
jgi:hypothetical protein